MGVNERLWLDLIREKHLEAEGTSKLKIVLRPYDVAWLKPIKEVEGKKWI